jgi:hypothetical protein
MAEIQPIDLNKKTVFILGAGASAPYGFPLGTELKQMMITGLNAGYINTLVQNKFDKSLVRNFIDSLRRTDHPTIDIFLEKKKKFREIGAFAIAYILLPLEKEKRLLDKKDWYSRIFNILNFEKDQPNTDNITFVSLNYDRSLEHFLTIKIEANCADDLIEHAEAKYKKLRIIHAHGSLGSYPQIKYGANMAEDEILVTAAQGIRIISDQLEDSENFLNAQLAISYAENIVFIGFGYDPTTLKLLTKDVDLLSKRILGTIYKFDGSKMESLDSFFKHNFEVIDFGVDADFFVQRYLPLEPK